MIHIFPIPSLGHHSGARGRKLKRQRPQLGWTERGLDSAMWIKDSQVDIKGYNPWINNYNYPFFDSLQILHTWNTKKRCSCCSLHIVGENHGGCISHGLEVSGPLGGSVSSEIQRALHHLSFLLAPLLLQYFNSRIPYISIYNVYISRTRENGKIF